MKVSVALITYNHESYIKKCIDSILSQKVDFDFELVIGEDYSNDNTREIVREYKKKYPDKIKLILNEKNIGMNENYIQTIDACIGDYIAFIEGDDYWTDKNKLQIQSDFLDKNQGHSFCFHLVKKLESDGRENIIPEKDKRRELKIEDFLEKNFIGSCSVFFKREKIKNWPEWSNQIGMMDWLLYVLLLQNGTAGYIDKLMGTYRVHEKGINSGETEIANLKKSIQFLKFFKKHFKGKYSTIINCSISRFYFNISKKYFEEKKFFVLLKFFLMFSLGFFVNPHCLKKYLLK